MTQIRGDSEMQISILNRKTQEGDRDMYKGFPYILRYKDSKTGASNAAGINLPWLKDCNNVMLCKNVCSVTTDNVRFCPKKTSAHAYKNAPVYKYFMLRKLLFSVCESKKHSDFY